ncbi:MAG: isoprenylcysteine carboxylmethyltransferase family protein [Spirochaetales bacterium]|nr:isoprenylcysteine carboxylmethyltransferase family protein [Candidatus Physcosoma equi]
MDKKLFKEAMIKFSLGFTSVSILLFLPAGTFSWFGGQLLLGILFIPMFFAGIVMMVKNPTLLEKRLRARETRKEQSLVIKLSGLMFLLGFILAGLGVRFHWYMLPRGVQTGAAVLFLASYMLYGEVLRENTYLSRTIEVQDGQRVIDTGLYGIVRHPMYSVTVVLFLSMPLVLGSLYAFLIFLSYPFILVKRIRNEEELLEKELEGYKEYKEKVKYRLVPLVW